MLVIFLLAIAATSTLSSRLGTAVLAIRGGAEDTVVESNEAFKEIGDFLLRVAAKERNKTRKKKGKRGRQGGGDSPWSQYEERHILRALNKLSAGQAALKTMDGATHRFRNAVSSGASSLEARYESFLSDSGSGKVSKKKSKEAGKLYEYVSAIERFLQGAEVLQAASQTDNNVRREWFSDAGLEQVMCVPLSANKLHVVMYVLKPKTNDEETPKVKGGKGVKLSKEEKEVATRPRKYDAGETVIVFVEATSDSAVSLAQMLRVMGEEPLTLPLSSVGFVQEDVTIQPTFLDCAKQALERLEGVFVKADNAHAADEEARRGESGGEDDSEKVAREGGEDEEEAKEGVQSSYTGSVRIFGYSAGAAVGGLVGMVLDGSLRTDDSRANPAPPLRAGFKHRMQAVLVAPPPCISRSIVSQNILSLVCGDDVVPRTSPDSITRLRRRVLRALQGGAGKGGFSGLGYTASAGFLRDMKAVTGKSVKTYTSGEHDLSSLRVPGRVFYLKARAHKEGASLQRVMRGNWREDMLWQLNEVLLSDRMLKHHGLDYHVQTLDRL